MKLGEQEKERLRTLTVEVLLTVRAAYLAEGNNALKHWTRITDRMRGACRTSENPEEWYSTILRTLQIQSAPSLASSRCLLELADYVRERGCAEDWLDLIEREWGLVIAIMRDAAEKKAEARNKQEEAENVRTD